MTSSWCNNSSSTDEGGGAAAAAEEINSPTADDEIQTITCPCCDHIIRFHHNQAGIIMNDLPAGVKFDPTDNEILEHLEAKLMSDPRKLHPLIHEFIPTLDGHNGICYTHPEKLPGFISFLHVFLSIINFKLRVQIQNPSIFLSNLIFTPMQIMQNDDDAHVGGEGVSKDGQIRHFFHRPSRAYTTGTRKRRKVHTDDQDGSETRWHKTGKTRAVFAGHGSTVVKGFKKILVLYTNYGRQRKPEKTNWVMHQYHLGNNEEEKDGELVVSKVFYQTQPRQCGNKDHSLHLISGPDRNNKSCTSSTFIDHHQYFPIQPCMSSYDHHGSMHYRESSPDQLIIPNLVVQGDGSSFVRYADTDTISNK